MPFLDINCKSLNDFLTVQFELEIHGYNFKENEEESMLYLYVDSEEVADTIIEELEDFLSVEVEFYYDETDY